MIFKKITETNAKILFNNYKNSSLEIREEKYGKEIARHPNGMYSCSFETPKYWDSWSTIFHLLFPINTLFPEMFKPEDPKYKNRVSIHFGLDLSDETSPKRIDILCYKNRLKDTSGQVIEDADPHYYTISDYLYTDILFLSSYPNGYYPWACAPNCH